MSHISCLSHEQDCITCRNQQALRKLARKEQVLRKLARKQALRIRSSELRHSKTISCIRPRALPTVRRNSFSEHSRRGHRTTGLPPRSRERVRRKLEHTAREHHKLARRQGHRNWVLRHSKTISCNHRTISTAVRRRNHGYNLCRSCKDRSW